MDSVDRKGRQTGRNGAAASPFEVLGLTPAASDREVREAYARAIEEHPIEKDPEGFAAVRDAFRLLRDPVSRSMLELDSIPVPESLLKWAKGCPDVSLRHAGPRPWLDVLKK